MPHSRTCYLFFIDIQLIYNVVLISVIHTYTYIHTYIHIHSFSYSFPLWLIINLKIILSIIYLFLAVLGLHCCVGFSLAPESAGYSPLCMDFPLWWLLLLWSAGSRCVGFSYGSQALEHGLSSCGTWASMFCRMWDLPQPGIEPVSPALTGIFCTTEVLGKLQS